MLGFLRRSKCVYTFSLFGLLLIGSAEAQTAPSGIRSKSVERIPQARVSDGFLLRSRAVELDLDLFDQQAARTFGRQRRKTVHFPLFADTSLTVDLDNVEESADGKTTVWSGRVRGNRFGNAVIAVTEGMLSANFTTDAGEKYQIRPAENSVHWVQEVDREPALPEMHPVPATNEVSRSIEHASSKEMSRNAIATVQATQDTGAQIDVMVVYTAAARAAAGGTAQMQNLVQLGIAETNQGYANSGITQRVRLVYSGEVNYAESGDFNTELTRLRNPSDGFLDDVPALREQYGADIVSLWVETGNACGIGYQMTSMNWDFSPYAYNVVMRSCATGYYSFGHEMGHNMGAQHDKADSSSPGVYAYSYGYQQMSVQPYFRTVMAYACASGINCPRINYWSNPDVKYSAIATGLPGTANPGADNRTTLNSTNVYVANYRKSVSSTPPPAPQPTLNLNATSASVPYTASLGTVTITATTGYAWTAMSNNTWLAITANPAGSGNGTVGYAVQANSTTTSRTGTLTIGGKTFTVTQAAAPPPPAPVDNHAKLVSPALGTTLASRTVTFTWSPGPVNSQYWLYVGTTPGNYDIYSGSQFTNTSKTLTNLPNTGRPIYVTLWTFYNMGWLTPLSYSYTTCANCDALPTAQ